MIDNVLYSVNAHFPLKWAVNRRNYRCWDVVNPKMKHEKPLHSPQVQCGAKYQYAELLAHVKCSFRPRFHEFEGFNANTWIQQDEGHSTHDQKIFFQGVIS